MQVDNADDVACVRADRLNRSVRCCFVNLGQPYVGCRVSEVV